MCYEAVVRGRLVEDFDLRFGGNDFTYMLIRNCSIYSNTWTDRNRGLEPSQPISIVGREIRSLASGFLSGSRKSSPIFSSPPAAAGSY